MKIYGPYLRKDGRKHIVIVHDSGYKQTKSYPKYLLEQKIGRELTGDETCDHIDGDFTNDDSNNLQILSFPKNIIKSKRPASYLEFVCPQCGKTALKRESQIKHNKNQGKAGPFCSRTCAGLASRKK